MIRVAACAAVEREFDDAEAERVRRLTVLPVSLVHDEYMFIRLLQCYEATFAFIAVKLREAIDAPETAAEAIAAAEQAMLAARPLWSMVATMRARALPGVPRVHRRRQRDPVAQLQARREPVRAAVAGAARLAGLPVGAGGARARARPASRRSATSSPTPPRARRWNGSKSALAHWRNSHYKLAMKMLGERRGTGYTEGVPYLNDVRSLPVFAAA